jgi:hypothetical protein
MAKNISEYILPYRKMRTKVTLAADEVFNVQLQLVAMGNITAAEKATKIYTMCHELTDLLKWAETMAQEIATLANE